MLTLEDCIAFCDLTAEEIAVIAAHEKLPEIVALELGNYLVQSNCGVPMIRRIIIEDIRVAEARGDGERVLHLKAVLHQFIVTHPKRRHGAGKRARKGAA